MPLTPLDIVNKEFKHGFRGYNEDDVNEFLDEIVRDYEALIRENDELKENTSGMTERLEQYRKLEATLQNTLVIAQQTAEEVKAAARKEAELIVREAEAKAEEIIRNAEARVREAENQLSQLRYETEKFRVQIKSLLEAQLRLVTEGPLLQAAVES
ncbi:DivIVA domain-containing protein [Sulfobacillus thermosulfidooxidans]|uniref:DivIVA domain-containing protein n=1 Tax=Sulfobacillus thermosulfidooxidans TaxID=28034 RepID=UPI00096B6E3F|nr:DivIVA domain-containing protein [Sulfobacillus thermosulfidooxidans]OLZ09788.1 septum formation initiator [Sulfobacillus thermosulfidooxidans]OLZ15905.1 septum formation initiator [Sulfobacillus thermosulfidooxidans]OLZ18247.1 septum formation initiator [Sulfobacillus thermosulfidooxidans]